jgi:hypothetical protein
MQPAYLDNFRSAEAERRNWENLWQDVSDYVLPVADFTTTRSPGTQRGEFIYDITARNANDQLISGLHGLLTTPYMKWFVLQPQGPVSDDEQEWLDELSDYLYYVFNDTDIGFNTQIHEFYIDYVTFGTGCMYVFYDEKASMLRMRAVPLNSIFIDEDENGRVNRLYRKRKFKVGEAHDRWPTPALARQLRSDPNSTVDILQACEPVYGDSANPYRLHYYDLTNNDELEGDNKLDNFPFAVARFSKRAGEVYGTSPSIEALPSIRALNSMHELTIRGWQKLVDPPMFIEDDSVIGGNPITMNPGGINYIAPGAKVSPYVTNQRPDFGAQLLQMLKDDIYKSYKVDYFNTPQRPNMTATEFTQREQQGLRQLSPMQSRLTQEAAGTIINLVIQAAIKHKKFPAPPARPPGMQPLYYQISYMSVVAQSQAASEANSVIQSLSLYQALAQLTGPQVLMNLNSDQIARELPVKSFKLPQRFLLDEEQVTRNRQEMAEQAKAAQEAAVEEQQSKTAKNATQAAKNLSNAGDVGISQQGVVPQLSTGI